MPHNWASAEFIRLCVHLVALERGSELHLLEGLPRAWLKPGMTTRLDGLRTPFGPLTLRLTVAADGRQASLAVAPLSDPSCRKIVVHWPDAAGVPRPLRGLSPSQAHAITLPQ
jgi:hypothetical protein